MLPFDTIGYMRAQYTGTGDALGVSDTLGVVDTLGVGLPLGAWVGDGDPVVVGAVVAVATAGTAVGETTVGLGLGADVDSGDGSKLSDPLITPPEGVTLVIIAMSMAITTGLAISNLDSTEPLLPPPPPPAPPAPLAPPRGTRPPTRYSVASSAPSECAAPSQVPSNAKPPHATELARRIVQSFSFCAAPVPADSTFCGTLHCAVAAPIAILAASH